MYFWQKNNREHFTTELPDQNTTDMETSIANAMQAIKQWHATLPMNHATWIHVRMACQDLLKLSFGHVMLPNLNKILQYKSDPVRVLEKITETTQLFYDLKHVAPETKWIKDDRAKQLADLKRLRQNSFDTKSPVVMDIDSLARSILPDNFKVKWYMAREMVIKFALLNVLDELTQLAIVDLETKCKNEK